MTHNKTVQSYFHCGPAKLVNLAEKQHKPRKSLTSNHKDDGGRCQYARGQVEKLVDHVGSRHGQVSLGNQGGRAQQVYNVGHG